MNTKNILYEVNMLFYLFLKILLLVIDNYFSFESPNLLKII